MLSSQSRGEVQDWPERRPGRQRGDPEETSMHLTQTHTPYQEEAFSWG